jgi:transcriptional regulator with XRE-family HTH domain
MNGPHMTFGEPLRGLWDGAGLCRAALARRAGVSAGTLRNWEHDRGFPKLPALLRLAGALPLGDQVVRLPIACHSKTAYERSEPPPRPAPPRRLPDVRPTAQQTF